MSQRTSTPRPLTEREAAFAQHARVARLATAGADGRPSVVPVCFAIDGARCYTPLDEKPKRASDQQLQRVRNLHEQPEAALLIDHYDDDWSQLGYVLIRGAAELLVPGAAEHAHALTLLRERYAQYRGMALEDRPVIAITAEHVKAWGPALAAESDQREAANSGAEGWLAPGRGLDFLPLARNRRSVRRFAERPVPRAVLEEMLEAARWAPSPHGRQPWRFVVLSRDEPKARLAQSMGADWQGILEMDGEPPEAIARRLELSRLRIRSAPALVLACLYLEGLDQYPDPDRQRAEEVMAIQSLGAAIQNMLLSAYSVGLDTGWMCAPLFSPDAVRDALNLPAALIPHALIPVGYAAAPPKRRPHRPVAELVARWD